MLKGHFFYSAEGAISESEKVTSLIFAKSWGHYPPVPSAPVLTKVCSKGSTVVYAELIMCFVMIAKYDVVWSALQI